MPTIVVVAESCLLGITTALELVVAFCSFFNAVIRQITCIAVHLIVSKRYFAQFQ